jgi:hypothetical protein
MNDFTAAAELLKQQQTGAVSPLARAAETMKAQQAGQVGMALTYDERDPDAEAKSRQVGAALGINPVVVGADPEAYDLQLRMKQAADGLRQAPKTAAWLADRENGVLAKDDLDNLTWWERVLNAPSQGLVEMGDAAEGSAAGRMIERGVRRIPMAGDVLSVQGTSARIADVGRSLDDLIAEELAQVGGDSAPAPMRSMALMAAQVRFDAARDLSPEDVRRLLDRGSAALLSARERSDKIASIPMSGPATAFRDETLANAEDTFLGALGAFASDPIRGAAFAAEVAGEFLPAILGASAVTVVTRSPAAGALTLGTVSGLTENAASTMEFLAERGVRMETPEDAMAALQDADLMQAARDRGLTRGLVIGMMDAISGGVAGKTLMKSPAGDMIAQGLAQVGLGGGGEALGQLASGQNVSWKDIVIEGLAELVTAPIEVIGVGGRRLLRGAVKAGTAGETAETLAEADAQAAASRLKVRAPEKFREALEAQGLGDKTIHVPADALREYFQAKDVAFDEDTMRAWGIDPVTFDEAAQSGNAVAVPASNYATYIAGTDAAAWFAENATTDPEELSLAEVRAFNMRVQDIMQDAFEEAEAARLDQDATRAADVQIYDDMFSQLREAGRSPDAARQEATMWAAFWRTMGERYGEDPLDMSRDMPVRVRGPQSPEFRRRDALDIALNTLRTKGEKALKPRGLSLAEFVKAKGGVQDAGGDVAAMDAPKGVVAETAAQMKARASQPSLGGVMPAAGRGMSLDEMGRLAAEAGYFPDLIGEVNIGTKGEASDFAARLLDALSEDVAGRKVYAEGEGPDPDMQALADALSERALDPATMTNDEIAAALDAAGGAEYGQPGLVRLYHGTSAEAADSIKDAGEISGPAFFTSRRSVAEDYAGPDGVVIPVDVPLSDIMVDLDMPGARLLSPEEASAYLGRDDLRTAEDFIAAGYSVGVKGGVKIDKTMFQPDGSIGNRGSIVLPQGGVRAGQTVINLFESANLSTFIHESGHFFLEAFNALASEEHAPQAMKDDLAAIFAWLGVKGWGQVGVPQHEQWARGFEAYVMEGKAPSLALADAFARFKAWLTRIYRTARGLKVNITPEIREVMDRMLATDAEIKAAREEQAMRPLFADAPPGMSQTDFTTYQRMARRAVDQAEQSLMARVMAKVRREREAWYRAEKKAVLAEVTADVERRREYRLVDLLANQSWQGAVDGAEIPDMQIDRKALVEQFGDGVLAEVSRQQLGGKRAIYGDNGTAPEEVAQFFGFASAAEMVRTLQNTPRKRDAIAAEVERRMVERHGDPLNDGTIEEEALAAIHSEQQANLSVAEARHMARRLGRDTAGMTAKIYRHRAREMVGRMMVRDVIRPERFLASERKAARAAQDAFATVARGTGKAEQALAEALQAKEQQILNGFIYDESRNVAEYVQKGREKMRAYTKKSVREKLDGGYIEQIDAILEDYDFRIRGQRQIARAESLKAFVDRMIEEGREGELNVDARLIDAVNRRHYTKLSVDELRGLFDTVANIDHMGRFKQALIDRKRKRELQASADRVSGLIRKNLGTGKAGERHRIAEAFNLLWRTDTLLIRMDGGEELGGAYDEVKRSIDEATSEEHRMNVEMAERLDALFKSHYSAADIRRMKVERDIPGANDRAWSKLEILAVALNAGNEDNYLRLTAPDAAMKNRLTKGQVDALLATMDDTDWRFVQDMWDMVNSYWSGLAEVAHRRTGVVPKKVEAKLMVGAPSFVTGGYYPISYDPTLSAAAAADEASAWDKFTATGRGATAAIRNGMTKQRAKSGGGRTLRLDVSVAFAHMRDTIRYIALSEAVDNTYRLISHPDVMNAFLDAGAKDQHDILKLWLKDVAKGPSPSPDAFNTMFRIVKNNFTLSRLALNFKTVAMQVTGVGQSAVVIGKRNMVRGYLEYLRNPRGTAAAVVAMSVFMRERRSTFQKDIHDFMDDTQLAGPVASGYKKGKAVVGKIGFAPIVWTQFWAVDMPTWLGAFRSGVERFGDEGKAAHYADRMVARSQDSGLMADRAAFERGTLSETTRQADVVRFFTTLGGYMLTKMNRAHVEAMRARIGWRDADAGAQRVGVVLTAATNLALLYWTEAILTALLWSALSDDDDDDDLKGFLLRETGSAIVGGIPIIRDVYSALMGFGGGGIYGSVADAPARLLTQAAQGENDAALRRAIADSVGMITGLPTTGPMRAIEGALSDDVPMSEALLGRNPLAR